MTDGNYTAHPSVEVFLNWGPLIAEYFHSGGSADFPPDKNYFLDKLTQPFDHVIAEQGFDLVSKVYGKRDAILPDGRMIPARDDIVTYSFATDRDAVLFKMFSDTRVLTDD